MVRQELLELLEVKVQRGQLEFLVLMVLQVLQVSAQAGQLEPQANKVLQA
jgi:hypothetical protein